MAEPFAEKRESCHAAPKGAFEFEELRASLKAMP
jgi:hypothetical protein